MVRQRCAFRSDLANASRVLRPLEQAALSTAYRYDELAILPLMDSSQRNGSFAVDEAGQIGLVDGTQDGHLIVVP